MTRDYSCTCENGVVQADLCAFFKNKINLLRWFSLSFIFTACPIRDCGVQDIRIERDGLMSHPDTKPID